jgi:TPR repeat protein
MKLAASLGNADAMIELGFDYRDGIGTAVDRAEAAKWYERAAERGDATATELLGEAFLSGQGVELNREKAFQLMYKAARAGNAMAEFNVGTLYLQGEVVPQDRVKAAEFLSQAVKSGFTKALVNLANCYAMGDGAPRDDVRAFQIYQEAADTDHSPVAAFNVAMTYLGRGPIRVPIDSQKGLQYLQMAADGGFPPAIVQVANVALNEQHDLTRYKQLMKRAAELGYTPAMLTR